MRKPLETLSKLNGFFSNSYRHQFNCRVTILLLSRTALLCKQEGEKQLIMIKKINIDG